MEASLKTKGDSVTPSKEKSAHSNRSKRNENIKNSENINSNVSSPGLKFSNSPSIAKSEKSDLRVWSCLVFRLRYVIGDEIVSGMMILMKKICERKFVVAKKKSLQNQESESNSADVVVACEKRKVNRLWFLNLVFFMDI